MTNHPKKSSTGSQTESAALPSSSNTASLSASISCLTAATEELFSNISSSQGRDGVAELMERHIQHYSKHRVPMVDFEPGCDWHNVSRSLHLYEDLRGRVSVLDFFTYCCINCLHVLPQLRTLEELYPPLTSPLAVIGVHSAKFSNEKASEKLAAAICRYGISHPVINDSQSAMWQKLGIVCWPTLVVLGPACEPVFAFVGETHGEELRLGVEYLLNHHQHAGVLSSTPPLPLAPSQQVRDESTVLRYPGGVTAFGGDDLLITDTAHHRLVLTTVTGRVKEVIGSGERGFRDGDMSSAQFSSPQGSVVSAEGVIYVADTENHAIRKVCLESRTVSTVAGTGAQGTDLVGGSMATEQAISSPWAVCLTQLPDDDAAVLLIAVAGTHQVWALYLTNGTDFAGCPRLAGSLVCVAGSGKEENRNTGYPLKASFAQPSGICTTKFRLPLPTKPISISVGKENLPPVPHGSHGSCVPSAPPPPPLPPVARSLVNELSFAPRPVPFVASASVPLPPSPPPPSASNNAMHASQPVPPPPPPSRPVNTSMSVPPPPPVAPSPVHSPPPSSHSSQSSPTIHGVSPPPPPPPPAVAVGRSQPPPIRVPPPTLHRTPNRMLGEVSVAVIADAESSSIRLLRLDTGAVINVVGGSSDPTDLFAYGDTDGVGTKARLQHPLAVAAAPNVVYIADTYNHKIKKVTACPISENKNQTPRFEVTSLSLQSGELSEPSGLCAIGSRLYVADTNHHSVKVIDLSSDPPAVSELVLDMPAAAEDETDGKSDAGSDLGVVLLATPGLELLKVAVRLVLPPGVTLTPDAPSSWTARAVGAEVRLSPEEGRVTEPGFLSFSISPPTAATKVSVSGRLYVCLSSGLCTATALKSSFTIAHTADAGAAVFPVQAADEVEIPLDVVV
ncbi:Thioredoxin-like fold [Trinorchestia longiramus]|nr:Thioredoxin-like fold [Trinorchestia longiramus]